MRQIDLESYVMKDVEFGWKATNYDVLEKHGDWAWVISSRGNGNIDLATKRLALRNYYAETITWGGYVNGAPRFIATALIPTVRLPE